MLLTPIRPSSRAPPSPTSALPSSRVGPAGGRRASSSRTSIPPSPSPRPLRSPHDQALGGERTARRWPTFRATRWRLGRARFEEPCRARLSMSSMDLEGTTHPLPSRAPDLLLVVERPPRSSRTTDLLPPSPSPRPRPSPSKPPCTQTTPPTPPTRPLLVSLQPSSSPKIACPSSSPPAPRTFPPTLPLAQADASSLKDLRQA